jgi:hypothetical protein
MDFDVDRMLKLSGLDRGESEVLTESAEEDATPLNESAQISENAGAEEETLSETSLRNIIREELKEILQNMKENTSDASWLYGKKKPSRSRSGQVTRGFFGLGFSNED